MLRDPTSKSNSRILVTNNLAPDTRWLADHYDIKNDAVGNFSRTIKSFFLITGKGPHLYSSLYVALLNKYVLLKEQFPKKTFIDLLIMESLTGYHYKRNVVNFSNSCRSKIIKIFMPKTETPVIHCANKIL